MEDAELALVSMGTMGATARLAVDAARERGLRAGSLRLRMLRPFPEAPLRQALAGARRVAVLDRDISPCVGGIVWSEIRGLVDREALVQGYMVGVGGGDVRPPHLERILEDLQARSEPGAPVLEEVG
jgi:pyruvate/2-oxoacid:ferredoxin oxidoreductase alpha subunit